MELTMTLDFGCCGCQGGVSVTLQCKGKGLLARRAGDSTPLAAVKVPCPTCGQLNQVFFETDGSVRLVQPTCPLPTPSLN